MGVKIYNEMDLGKVQEIKGNSGQGGDLPAPELNQEIENLQNQLQESNMQSAVLVTEITQMLQAQEEKNNQAVAELTNMIAVSMGGME